jgi:hypothetical protein
MGLGLALAVNHWAAGLLIGLYLGLTLLLAIRTEEAYLRARFGDAYDRYAVGTTTDQSRRFSLARAVRNKEYRAPVGFLLISLFLLWRSRS